MRFLGASIWYWIVGALVSLAVGALGLYSLGFHNGDSTGEARCTNAHLEAQIKTNDKVHKGYDKIDRKTPFAGNKSARIKWLLDNARNGK